MRLPVIAHTHASVLVLTILSVWSLLPFPAAAADASSSPVRIVLTGDSTVATNLNPPKDRPTLAGWGQMLGDFLPRAEVINLARSGTSTKSFRTIGLWDKALAARPNYIFIQFGHNDQPGKGPLRHTDAATEYRDNLRRFITEARAIGAQPVLVTSVARRTYDEKGKLTSSLVPYVEAALAVAKETQVPAIDLHHVSFLLFDQLGEKFCRLYAPSDTDRTHFSREGARMIARLVAEGITREVPALAAQVQLVPPPPANTPFTVKLETLSRGFDGETCWVHPRAGAIPPRTPGGQPSVVLTMQKLLLTGSDVFYALNDLRTDDLGKTWSPIREHADTLGRREEPGGTIVAACDFTPKWHAKSGKLLGIGHTVRYQDNKVMLVRAREASYSVYDEATRTWAPWATLDMPDLPQFFNSGAGCVQRVDLDNGDILLPVYFKGKEDKHYSVTVLRCSFDGATLRYLGHGNHLALASVRGLVEPSLTRFQGRFYLTLRNDNAAYVSTSEDGLNYTPIQPWEFNDGTPLGNYNTQQHWVTHGDKALYLVYNRKGEDLHNDHVVRHRAPLLMAQVKLDPANPGKPTLLRETEVILVPERGARLGNFGVTEVSDTETWVTVAEWMQKASPNIIIPPANPFGADNSVYAAKILWQPPAK